jgi:hypothetical protein
LLFIGPADSTWIESLDDALLAMLPPSPCKLKSDEEPLISRIDAVDEDESFLIDVANTALTLPILGRVVCSLGVILPRASLLLPSVETDWYSSSPCGM